MASLALRVKRSARKRPRDTLREVCPHCNQNLNIKTLKKHKALFLKADGTWIQDSVDAPGTDAAIESTEQPPELPSFEMGDGMGDLVSLDCGDSSDAPSCDESSIGSDSHSEDLEIWNGDDDDDLTDDITTYTPSLPIFSNPAQESTRALLMWVIGFLLRLQAKYYIPDASINLLIKFFGVFVSVTGHFSTFMKGLADVFPRSLNIMISMAKGVQVFTKFVVCDKCHTLYDYATCEEKIGSRTESKHCTIKPFPNHPYHSGRIACNNLLLKSVEVASGRLFLYPYKIYCYKSLKSSLEKLFLLPSFYEHCQYWKSRPVSSNGALNDVYDGAVWKEFQSVLLTTFSVGLMLNIDWFQPYTHTVSSVGVMYLTIMNLPRHIRSKQENIILVGVIPGPHEPKHDINTYLGPLVEELLLFWEGVPIDVAISTGIVKKTLRCALLCVSCDLPAIRKACGFLSHSAALGCSKCLKKFPGNVGEMNYSGFDCSTWPKRTAASHRESVKKINACRSKSTQQNMESKLGCRHSALLDLPYFDSVRMHVIDPMHNLFLGSGKRMMVIWKQKSLVQPCHYESIQRFVDSISVPSDVGRIPQKIESGFSGFKADQFKNWINIYSIPSLVDILPEDSLECWRHFVLACRILCKQNLTAHDVDLAHVLLVQFCRRVQNLYGESSITPNMHLHAHLKEVIRDYGPLQEFWCFSFERFNGILGKQPTNNRLIEPQLMKRFMRHNFSSSIVYPELFAEEFSPIVSACTSKLVGSVSETTITNIFKLCSRHTRAVFSSDEISGLTVLLPKINTTIPESAVVDVNSIYMKFSSITLNGKVFFSAGKKTKPTVAMAFWEEDLYGKPPTPLVDPCEPNVNIRPVNVHYYAKIVYSVDGAITHDIILAFVSWFFPHQHRYSLGKPAELWCNSIFEPVNYSCSFVPIKNLISRCAHGIKLNEDEHLLVIVPLVE